MSLPSPRDRKSQAYDLGGNRCVNLGAPTDPADATYTDNATVPAADAGAGSPGVSLLASPSDHQHPAAPQGVTALNAMTGGINIFSSDGSVSVVAGAPPQTVDLEVPAIQVAPALGDAGLLIQINDAGVVTRQVHLGAAIANAADALITGVPIGSRILYVTP